MCGPTLNSNGSNVLPWLSCVCNRGSWVQLLFLASILAITLRYYFKLNSVYIGKALEFQKYKTLLALHILATVLFRLLMISKCNVPAMTKQHTDNALPDDAVFTYFCDNVPSVQSTHIMLFIGPHCGLLFFLIVFCVGSIYCALCYQCIVIFSHGDWAWSF